MEATSNIISRKAYLIRLDRLLTVFGRSTGATKLPESTALIMKHQFGMGEGLGVFLRIKC